MKQLSPSSGVPFNELPFGVQEILKLLDEHFFEHFGLWRRTGASLVHHSFGLAPGSGVDMLVTCAHASDMSKMVQIRNVPDQLHRTLKARAAHSGQTLSDYLLAELERLAARPTRDEMLTRLHSRKRVTLKTPAAVVIRQERESA